MRRAAVSVVLASLALGGCAIDTELGLDVTVGASSVEVRAEPDGDVVGVSMDVTYRVGEHAQSSHTLTPQAIDVWLGDVLVATITPNRPPGFVMVVNPGQSFGATFTGASRPGIAADPRDLCGAEATLLFHWTDGTDLGMAEAMTSAITCD
jgi:hypothetical protein